MAEDLASTGREPTIEERALLFYRQHLEARKKEEENSLPRHGKAPATAEDQSRDRNFESQLRAIETSLNARQESPQQQVTKGEVPSAPPPAKSSKADSTAYVDTEPYVNPFTGQLIVPETPDAPGPSTSRVTTEQPASGDEKPSQTWPTNNALQREPASRCSETVARTPSLEASATEFHKSAETGNPGPPSYKSVESPRPFDASTMPPARYYTPSSMVSEAISVPTFVWGSLRRMSSKISFTNRGKSQAARLQKNESSVMIPAAHGPGVKEAEPDRASGAAEREPGQTLDVRDAVPPASSNLRRTVVPHVGNSPGVSIQSSRQQELPYPVDQTTSNLHDGQKDLLVRRNGASRHIESSNADAEHDGLNTSIHGFQGVGNKAQSSDTNAKGSAMPAPAHRHVRDDNTRWDIGSVEGSHHGAPSSGRPPEHKQDPATKTRSAEHSPSGIKHIPVQGGNISGDVTAILQYQEYTGVTDELGEGVSQELEALLQALGEQGTLNEDLASLELAKQLAGVTPQDYRSLAQLQDETDVLVRQLQASDLEWERRLAADHSVAQGLAADAPQDTEKLLRAEAERRLEESRKAQEIADAADRAERSRLQEESRIAKEIAEAADRAEMQAEFDNVRRIQNEWNTSEATGVAAQQELARTLSEREDQLDWERQKQELQKLQDDWNRQEQDGNSISDSDAPVMAPGRPAENTSSGWSATFSQWFSSAASQTPSTQQESQKPQLASSSSRDVDDLAQAIAERRQRQAQWQAETQKNAQAAEENIRQMERKHRELAEKARREEEERRAAAERERRERQADCTVCGETAEKSEMALTPCDHYYDRECINGQLEPHSPPQKVWCTNRLVSGL